MSSANGNRVGVSQPGGPGSPAVVGILDSRHIFWPELEVSFASDGFIETSEVSDDKPQDWKYLVAQAEEMTA